MPYVVNGIGTWYYGKRNVHRLRGVCQFCSNINDLESYDTTLYFVVVFIPLIPLSSKRIIEACPACDRHRVLPLKTWQKSKSDAVEGVLEKLSQDPDNRETILEAIGISTGFQDEALFDKLSASLANHRTEDAELQAALGDANSYFARHEKAVEAYQHSLRANYNPRVRDQLGLSLIRLGDPAQAEPCFEHILEEADKERLWIFYQLAVAYQAKGMHVECLEMLKKVNEVFPETATSKPWKALQKTSEKYKDRGKPVGKATLMDSGKSGTREGSKLGSLIPKLVLPLLVLAYGGWHTCALVTLAESRPVYLVNGSPKQYTVEINGASYQMAANSHREITVAEGAIQIKPGAGAEGLKPSEVTIEGSFWSRPYNSTIYLLNPDNLGIAVKETALYKEGPHDNPPDQYVLLKTLNTFTGIDYPFGSLPQSMKMKKGQTVTKVKLGLAPMAGTMDRVNLITMSQFALTDQMEYLKNWISLDPNESLVLAMYASKLPPEQALEMLKSRLGDRPLRIDWHRLYQSTQQRLGKDKELQAEYEKLVKETNRSSDALYLLSRIQDDNAVGDKLLDEAIASGQPANHAYFSRGYRQLCRGDFAAAVESMKKSGPVATQSLSKAVYLEALTGAKLYKDAIAFLNTEGNDISTGYDKLAIFAMAGDKDGVTQSTSQLLSKTILLGNTQLNDLMKKGIDARVAAAQGDLQGYLKSIGNDVIGGSLISQLLRNNWKAASEMAGKTENAGTSDVEYGLLLLTASAKDLNATRAQFFKSLEAGNGDDKKLKELLEKGGENLAGKIRDLAIVPGSKRVFAAAAGILYPDQKAALNALARQMNFHADPVSLLLNRELNKVPGAGNKAPATGNKPTTSGNKPPATENKAPGTGDAVGNFFKPERKPKKPAPKEEPKDK